MKKLLILIAGVLSYWTVMAQDKFYDIEFRGINRENIATKEYKGKKVIVYISDAINPDRTQLRLLDSMISKRNASIALIVLPVTDFGGEPAEINAKKLWKDTLAFRFAVGKPGKAGKGNGQAQHPLLQWLTQKEKNGHYDSDITIPGEMFVVGENGVLYARLKRMPDLKSDFMTRILTQKAPGK